MKPTGRFPAAQFIRTVSSVVIAAVGIIATILLAQDNLDALRQAAEQGDAKAQAVLGAAYAEGRGVRKDDVEAVRWYRLAAEQGNASAQYTLGFAYANGEGLPKDESEAVRWYQKAAEQGDASAQNSLGGMYANGRGVLKDDAEAVRCFRKAAEQGLYVAQYALGLMYARGRRVLKDDVLAHMWYNIAGANGHENARKNRDILERDMTLAEISRATELARACMSSNYQNCQQ